MKATISFANVAENNEENNNTHFRRKNEVTLFPRFDFIQSVLSIIKNEYQLLISYMLSKKTLLGTMKKYKIQYEINKS